jgi:hypothetical protein
MKHKNTGIYFFTLTLLLFCNQPVEVGAQSIQQSPIFSVESGFYANTISLELSSPVEGAQILYTLDGSWPHPDNIGGKTYVLKHSSTSDFTTRKLETRIFESPISIIDRTSQSNQVSAIPNHFYIFVEPFISVPKGNLVRAALYIDGELGPVETRTYFIGGHFQEYLNLPVLSIGIQEDDFWSYEYGIYVPGATFDPLDVPWGVHGNYNMRGTEWERLVSIEYFGKNGRSAINQRAGIRIHGGTSRYNVNRSFRLYARSEYGKSTIEYPFFENRPLHIHKRLKLRTAGQDYTYTYFRDELMSVLMHDGEVTTEAHQSVNVFLNGEYWGIMHLRERFDDHYMERNFNIPRDEAEIIETWSTDNSHYLSFRNFVTTADPNDANYFDTVNQYINLDSFLDKKIAEIFFGRWDIHWEVWRDGRVSNSKWNWVMWDFDVGMMLPGFGPGRSSAWNGPAEHDISMNYLERFLTDFRTNSLNLEFSLIVRNEQIRNRFINRAAQMMSSNLSENRMLREINRFQDRLSPSMQRHIERWSSLAQKIDSMEEWYESIEILRYFASYRQPEVYDHFAMQFGLGGASNLTLTMNDFANDVDVNGTNLSVLIWATDYNQSTSWTGTYFRNIPIQLVARPATGYRFDGWSGSVTSTNDTLYVSLSTAQSLVANFIETGEDPLNPEAFNLLEGDYTFEYWDSANPEGTFPSNAVFLQSGKNDPGLDDEMTDLYHIPRNAGNGYHANDMDKIGFPYMLTGRSRINGLHEDGISFINTGQQRDLGVLLLAINTESMGRVRVNWTGGTVSSNNRQYAFRLQYRVGKEGLFKDLLDEEGELSEYRRSTISGHEQDFTVILPDDALDEPYVQLRWKYYYTGVVTSGSRDELRLDDIKVMGTLSTSIDGKSDSPGMTVLHQNYPNPFNPVTTISYTLRESARIKLTVFNQIGQTVSVIRDDMSSAGRHDVPFQAENLSTGIYFYKLEVGSETYIRKMVLLR